MVRVQSFDSNCLPQLTLLVNLHLGAVMPGWGLTEPFLARLLERDDFEPITDPWVAERATLCAIDRRRIVAATHLLRYGDDPTVGSDYRGAGEIGWLVAFPECGDAAAAVLSAARERMASWLVTRELGWGSGFSVGPLWGVPENWPHIAAVLLAAGYAPDPSHHGEALYGGWLDGIPAPAEPPVAGLTVQRVVGPYETRLSALLDGQEIGRCDVQSDLSRSGMLPALRGWGWLTDLRIEEPWRNRGVGSCLVGHAVQWLRLAACDRVVLSVDAASEAAGAGRFYQRLGWDVFTQQTHVCRRG
ncbi:MAG: GNAT family N-acetyltransferase [Thermomicrobiales bacterium]